MLNIITIMGRMTRDPELRRTNSGTAVASFTLAVDRDRVQEGKERETDFIDCTAWAGTAEFVSKYFSKGQMAVVSGRLQIRNWVDKDENKRRNAEVVADHVWFGEGRKNNESDSVGNSLIPYPGSSSCSGHGASGYAMLEDDDSQLPF